MIPHCEGVVTGGIVGRCGNGRSVNKLTSGVNKSTLRGAMRPMRSLGAQIMTLTDISTAAPAPRAARLQNLSAREIARRIAAGDPDYPARPQL